MFIKFINNCIKEILRCASPSSLLCVVLFFWPNVLLLYALGFYACIFWPLGWLWSKNNFIKIWFSWSSSLQLFPAWIQVEKSFFLKKERVAGREELQGRASRKSGRAGQLNGWVPLVHLDCYHFKSRWNSSSTLSKRQIIEKFNVKKEKEVLLVFIISLFCK